MGFLAKFGQIVLKGLAIASGVVPIVSAAYPQTAGVAGVVMNDLQQIAAIIQQAEIFGQALNLPGASKLTAAAPAVAQIILQSSILANHKIADQAKFNAGVTQIASGMADVLSSLQDKVDTVDKTA